MMFGCKHIYGKIENGYQYCEKCNKAIAVPKNCNHKWKEIDKYEYSVMGNLQNILFVLRCDNCGELKKFKA